MAENNRYPRNPFDNPDPTPDPTPPENTPLPEDSDDSILDFGVVAPVQEGASGIIPASELPDPQSSPSLLSWTEVIRHHRETQSSHDISIEPIKIDSVSDKDLLKRIVAEEQRRQQAATAPEHDTDELPDVPMVTGLGKTGSSLELGQSPLHDPRKPLSGSAVRFDVQKPPSDAGGAMPMPMNWNDVEVEMAMPVEEGALDDIPFAMPVDDDESADAIVLEAEPASGDSVARLINQEMDEDITGMPLGDGTMLGEHSSILEMLINEGGSSRKRQPSDIVDVAASPDSGVLSGISGLAKPASKPPADDAAVSPTSRPAVEPGDSWKRAASAPAAPSAEVPTSPESPPQAEVVDDWLVEEVTPIPDAPSAPPVDGAKSRQTMSSFLLPAEDLDDAVDLYSEGPFSHGISDSGQFQLSDEEIEEAARKQRSAESSAIDLSSKAGSSSMFDLRAPAGDLDLESPGDDTVDMSLPPSAEQGSSMIARLDELSFTPPPIVDDVVEEALEAIEVVEDEPPRQPPRIRTLSRKRSRQSRSWKKRQSRSWKTSPRQPPRIKTFLIRRSKRGCSTKRRPPMRNSRCTASPISKPPRLRRRKRPRRRAAARYSPQPAFPRRQSTPTT